MIRTVAILLAFALSSVTTAASQAAAAGGKTPADLIVRGDYVLPMTEVGEPGADIAIIRDGAVAVADGVILAVGPRKEIEAAYRAKKSIPGEDRVLMPGLVNGHTHAAMALFRGVADDMDLMTWLTTYIFPLEGRFVDEDFVKAGASLACWEMIRGGTTAIVDMYFYPDTSAAVYDGCGIRAILGAPMIDFPSPGFAGWDDSFAAGVAFVERWMDVADGTPRHPRLTPAFAPHAAYTVTPEHYAAVLRAAKRLKAPITTHVLEDYSEVTTVYERYGATTLRHFDKLGLLDHRLIAAHVVWPDEGERALLAEHADNVGPIHNPTSNMKTAAGVSPVPEMLALGIQVGLGTDGAASNNDLDMWEEIRLAALLHKGAARSGERDPTVVPAAAALRMATSMGARAAGLGDVAGQLKEGYRADMIQVSLTAPRIAPLYNVVSHLVYVTDSEDVVTTIVEGRVLMENGRVLTLDSARVVADARKIGEKIAEALAEGK